MVPEVLLGATFPHPPKDFQQIGSVFVEKGVTRFCLYMAITPHWWCVGATPGSVLGDQVVWPHPQGLFCAERTLNLLVCLDFLSLAGVATALGSSSVAYSAWFPTNKSVLRALWLEGCWPLNHRAASCPQDTWNHLHTQLGCWLAGRVC